MQDKTRTITTVRNQNLREYKCIDVYICICMHVRECGWMSVLSIDPDICNREKMIRNFRNNIIH